MSGEKFLHLVSINPDQKSHVLIRHKKECLRCEAKTCRLVCPSGVFAWNEQEGELKVAWQHCVECGACEVACPCGNIDFSYPRGGFGVVYHI